MEDRKLYLRTLRGIDYNRTVAAERKRRQSQAWNTSRRRAASKLQRAEWEARSKTRMKPWEAEGKSRSAWYAEQKAQQETPRKPPENASWTGAKTSQHFGQVQNPHTVSIRENPITARAVRSVDRRKRPLNRNSQQPLRPVYLLEAQGQTMH